MRLSKYQKSRLLEFDWDVIENELCDDNTRWVHFDSRDGEVFGRLKQLLDIDDDVNDFKVLVIATQTTK